MVSWKRLSSSNEALRSQIPRKSIRQVFRYRNPANAILISEAKSGLGQVVHLVKLGVFRIQVTVYFRKTRIPGRLKRISQASFHSG